jgi:tryptophan synthase beta chain
MKPDRLGYFGKFGGRFVSELLIPALDELEAAYYNAMRNKKFTDEFHDVLNNYAGRPTTLYYAENISKSWNADIYLKREDMLHTGAHKINNTLGQTLLAKFMKKTRVIAETGAGQHGVATATAAALFKLPCKVYMGEEDLRRQALNGFRIKLLGSEIVGVGGSKGTLRDAVSEALRDWSTSVGSTHYVLGSAVGPHPFPEMVRTFQSVIGKEARTQILKAQKKLPDAVIACVGGGSNAIGMFYGFINDLGVKLYGVEAAGHGLNKGLHSAKLSKGKPGIFQGSLSYVLQESNGMVSSVHSVSAGLDYPGVGPEHAYLKNSGRAEYGSITDDEALEAFQELSQIEGIIPALESSHAIAYAKKWVKKFRKDTGKKPLLIINLSGRGDKDVAEVQRLLESQ